MLRIILLSLLWAVCSTFLVNPCFWKGLKEDYFVDYNDKEFTFGQTWVEIRMHGTICFIVVFGYSMFLYIAGFRHNLTGSLICIAICFLLQLLFSYNTKKLNAIFIAGLVISVILLMQDVFVSMNIASPLLRIDSIQLTVEDNQNSTNARPYISLGEIQTLFNVNSASGPTYNNGKYIYAVTGGNNGKGVVIIDKDDPSEARFIQCSREFEIMDIRFKYPDEKLQEIYITVSDDDLSNDDLPTPYGLFAVAEKSWFFGTYNVNGYILLNLVTGETQEFTEDQLQSADECLEDLLPDFVTNN